MVKNLLYYSYTFVLNSCQRMCPKILQTHPPRLWPSYATEIPWQLYFTTYKVEVFLNRCGFKDLLLILTEKVRVAVFSYRQASVCCFLCQSFWLSSVHLFSLLQSSKIQLIISKAYLRIKSTIYSLLFMWLVK